MNMIKCKLCYEPFLNTEELIEHVKDEHEEEMDKYLEDLETSTEED